MNAKFSGRAAIDGARARASRNSCQASREIARDIRADVIWIAATTVIEGATCRGGAAVREPLGLGRRETRSHDRRRPRAGDAIVRAREPLQLSLEELRQHQHACAHDRTGRERAGYGERPAGIAADDYGLVVVLGASPVRPATPMSTAGPLSSRFCV